MRLLLHACCGPCSLEPARMLNEAGHDLTIAYMNSNIHPLQEYVRRRDTLSVWAEKAGLPVIEGSYDPALWEQSTASITSVPGYAREDRCRACYRLRFTEVAAYAFEHGFEGISTTLSVSPYQFTSLIEEELGSAAASVGLEAVFKDFRPQYQEATRLSRELGMYRQNYCGCRFSDAEAACEREERRQARKALKEKERAEKRASSSAASDGASL